MCLPCRYKEQQALLPPSDMVPNIPLFGKLFGCDSLIDDSTSNPAVLNAVERQQADLFGTNFPGISFRSNYLLF